MKTNKETDLKLPATHKKPATSVAGFVQLNRVDYFINSIWRERLIAVFKRR